MTTKTVKAKDQIEPTKLDKESQDIIGGFFQQLAILTDKVKQLEHEIKQLKTTPDTQQTCRFCPDTTNK